MSTKRTVVFDLDGSLETPYLGKEDANGVKAWMSGNPDAGSFDRMYAEVLDGMPHFLLNGALELLQWVHARGFEIVFFSNAVRPRNEELCPILMERAFGKGKEPPYRIYSRPDCIDTADLHGEDRERYNGLWHGNYKKLLANVVVTPEELRNTLMIEDDNSYACRGEERNFVYGIYGGSANDFVVSRKFDGRRGRDFHLPFYFCGMLKKILAYSEKSGCSLSEAAVQVQYADFGYAFPEDGERRAKSGGGYVDVPSPPQDDYRIYVEGLKELRQFNPDLHFWGNADEKAWNWPKPDDPPPPPPPPPPKPKPQSEIGMRESEVRYRLKAIQEALRAVSLSNIKCIGIEGEGVGHFGMVDVGQSDDIDLSHSPTSRFPDRIDLSKVTSVRLYGYLPRKPDEQDRDGESEVKYEIFVRVLTEMLRDLLRIHIARSKIEVSAFGERWHVAAESDWKDDLAVE